MEQQSVDPDRSPAAGICGLLLPVHPRTGSTIHTASLAVGFQVTLNRLPMVYYFECRSFLLAVEPWQLWSSFSIGKQRS